MKITRIDVAIAMGFWSVAAAALYCGIRSEVFNPWIYVSWILSVGSSLVLVRRSGKVMR